MADVPLGKGRVVLVDDSDLPLLIRWRWYWCRNARGGYAYGRSINNPGRRHSYMHRVLMNPPADKDVDHINGDGLDNRRANLRICSRGQNLAHGRNRGSSGGYRGVYRVSGSVRYEAKIGVNGSRFRLGSFLEAIEAAKAYDRAARQAFGVFATTNFPSDGGLLGESE